MALPAPLVLLIDSLMLEAHLVTLVMLIVTPALAQR